MATAIIYKKYDQDFEIGSQIKIINEESRHFGKIATVHSISEDLTGRKIVQLIIDDEMVIICVNNISEHDMVTSSTSKNITIGQSESSTWNWCYGISNGSAGIAVNGDSESLNDAMDIVKTLDDKTEILYAEEEKDCDINEYTLPETSLVLKVNFKDKNKRYTNFIIKGHEYITDNIIIGTLEIITSSGCSITLYKCDIENYRIISEPKGTVLENVVM